MADPGVPAVARALYEERTLARIRCMRRTMFVLPAALAPVVQAAVGRDASMDRAKAMGQLRDAAGWDEDRYTAAERAASPRSRCSRRTPPDEGPARVAEQLPRGAAQPVPDRERQPSQSPRGPPERHLDDLCLDDPVVEVVLQATAAGIAPCTASGPWF
ncbi:DNA glycosylase AlkZ-like family protein [Streptomyces sp. NPDC004284]|uniref:DNA glycosylase AlkZ-like family protein n=1 Tax=Streptomyces sp. NPDC004284 TaxID=3364695 RepID=UPI00367BCC68